MKKIYIKPQSDTIVLGTVMMLAASGDTTSKGLSDDEFSGTFSAPSSSDFDDFDDYE